ncbi:MAG: response regulator transcription factor [Brevundimonas sp.]|uniref:LytR/AlgR family response regulator transcription factor n=1 Tax=Brevundimonas sp. TaxID=1871086 RepID=UPI0012015DD7|nr:LytTR family DNA-binding domain-containing protein [Brevundimonas sp.]RZJ17256.1 MAG: response regulator transcription factor [Brevundimonas sp.]
MVMPAERDATVTGPVPRLRILLVDDEPLARARMRVLLDGREDIVIVGEAGDAATASELIEAVNPDLLLLDIEMPGQDGLSLAQTLRARTEIGVVFVTAHYEFAVVAFEIDAIDYLLKPVDPGRLATALVKARRSRPAMEPSPTPARSAENDYANTLWVQSRGGLVGIPLSTIEWIEAARDYVLLHTDSRAHILRATMTGLERQLDPALMVRVSRSAFVRRDAIVGLTPHGRGGLVVILAGGGGVKVGATFVAGIGRQFANV